MNFTTSMQSFVTNRRTNSSKKYQFPRRGPYDDYKENFKPNDKLQITDDLSTTLSTKNTSSSNIVLRLSETDNISIDDCTTQSYKLASSSSNKKTLSSEENEVIVISDSSDDNRFFKKSAPPDNFKTFQNNSIYISSSSDESETEDFLLKYSDPKNTLSGNTGKRRISNNFKIHNTFKIRQRCSILYTSDDTASTASTKSTSTKSKSSSSSSKKSQESPISSVSHVSATPHPVTSDKSNKVSKPVSKLINKLRNPPNTKLASPSFCSTKYQKLFPRKIPNRGTPLSKAEALKILKVLKSKKLNYFSDSDKSQISKSPDSDRERKQNAAKKSNIIDETDSDNSKNTKSSGSQKINKPQKSNIVEETDSEQSIPGSPQIVQIQNEKVIEILQTPPVAKDPGYSDLSARKRKEIANWLMSNNPDVNSENSSFSHVSGSNRNSVCSGNSSLERLELNYETPNNRDKFLKLHVDKTRNADLSEEKTPVKTTTDVLNGLTLVDTNKRINIRTPIFENPPNVSTNTKSTETGGKRQTRIDDYLKKTKTISGKQVTVIAPRKNVTKTPAINSKPSSKTSNPEDVKIEDCVNILDKLYGDTWRAKADVILSEPRKQPVVKKDRGVQTERKMPPPRLNFDSESEEDLDFRKFVKNVRPTLNSTRKVIPETKSGTNKIKRKEIDSFINDNSSSDGSVPSSYYTAVTNPETNFKKKITDTPASTATLRAMAICDPDTDEEINENTIFRNNDVNRRKLTYSDNEKSSSSTSEFDPEDIIEPKTVIKRPIKKTVQHTSNSLNVKSSSVKKSVSFLASLSASVPISSAHPEARDFRENFKKTKEILCQRLFAMYNDKIFDNKLPKDMLIDWSSRMRGTAGFCYNKKSIKNLVTTRSSRIVLSTKVLDRPDRLRDTLVHELCHAASWIINELSDGHGTIWKGWAKKAMKVFPELPPISRCHNYKIHTKYTYKCVNCGYSIGRHSKSLNVELKRCGYCHGKFECFINRTTKSGNLEIKTPSRSKDPSAFALYVKENYQNVKQNRRSMKHGEVMKVLGQQFSAIKIAKQKVDIVEEN